MIKSKRASFIAAGLGMMILGSAAQAAVISVNFVGGGGPDANGNSITGPAGVVAVDNWTNLTTADSTYDFTGVQLTYDAGVCDPCRLAGR